MEHKYIQPINSAGCSRYCMSNLFNDDFLKRNESLGIDLNQRQENELLKDYNNDYCIAFIAYKNSSIPPLKLTALGSVILWMRSHLVGFKNRQELFGVLPLTITNKYVSHRVYVYVLSDAIYLSDPLEKGMIYFKDIYTLKSFFQNRKMYLSEVSAYCQLDDKLDERLIFFNKNDFKHIGFK